MARRRVWVQIFDGRLVAWDCPVKMRRRVAMAARDPAGSQQDGLIPARKGAPEQRPRPTTPPSLPKTVRALLSSGGYDLGDSSRSAALVHHRQINALPLILKKTTQSSDETTAPVSPLAFGQFCASLEPVPTPPLQATQDSGTYHANYLGPALYLCLHLVPSKPTDVQDSTYAAARYIHISIQPRAANLARAYPASPRTAANTTSLPSL